MLLADTFNQWLDGRSFTGITRNICNFTHARMKLLQTLLDNLLTKLNTEDICVCLIANWYNPALPVVRGIHQHLELILQIESCIKGMECTLKTNSLLMNCF